MERITTQDIAAMAGRVERNLRRHNRLDAGRVAVENGSKTNGNAYRVVVLADNRRYEPFGTFHFGFTARECYDRMHALCVAMEYV